MPAVCHHGVLVRHRDNFKISFITSDWLTIQLFFFSGLTQLLEVDLKLYHSKKGRIVAFMFLGVT